jgi:hypothetical protein
VNLAGCHASMAEATIDRFDPSSTRRGPAHWKLAAAVTMFSIF